MVYSAKSDASGTLTQFIRRIPIPFFTAGSSTPANYQVKRTISWLPGMQSLFQDIRFNTRAGIYIDYWIESKTDSDTAVVWLELPDAITDHDSDTVWMYYGNAGLSDGGVGADTFIQWHGATTSGFTDAEIIPPTNIIYEAKVRDPVRGNRVWGLSTLPLSDYLQIQSYPSGNARTLYVANDGTSTQLSETPNFVQGQWYKLKITCDGTNVHGYVDNNEIGTGPVTTNLPNANLGLFMETGQQEYSFARKYIANEPTSSIGTAQHQMRHPQYIS